MFAAMDAEEHNFLGLFAGYRAHMAVNSPNIIGCCSKGAGQPEKKWQITTVSCF